MLQSDFWLDPPQRIFFTTEGFFALCSSSRFRVSLLGFAFTCGRMKTEILKTITLMTRSFAAYERGFLNTSLLYYVGNFDKIPNLNNPQ